MQGTMAQVEINQPAIVFWMHHPGEITRFERLQDAVHSVMGTPSAKLFAIAWITTRDRQIDMEEIRQIERRSILSRHLGWAASPASPRWRKIPAPCGGEVR